MVDVNRLLRLCYRIPLLLLHMLIGLPLTLLTLNPIGRRIPTWSPLAGKRHLDESMICWWSANLCRIFGLRRQLNRALPPGPLLIVSNHLSWLDIQLLDSVARMGFVAKAEIREWFFFGWIAEAGGAVFHRRGSHDSSSGAVEAACERLREGQKVAIFAEGGILPGLHVKRFHARLFAAAIDCGVAVQPVMLRYLRQGRFFEDIGFRPNEGMIANVLRLLGQAPCSAEVQVLEPFSVAGMQRREAALLAHASVAEAYGID